MKIRMERSRPDGSSYRFSLCRKKTRGKFLIWETKTGMEKRKPDISSYDSFTQKKTGTCFYLGNEDRSLKEKD